MTWFAWLYTALHVVLFAVTNWMLALPQSWNWRAALVVLWAGVAWNLAGLIWFGYTNVWPGEFVATAGFCLILGGLICLRTPLVTRWEKRDELE